MTRVGDQVIYDPSGAFLPDAGVSGTGLAAMAPLLDKARIAVKGIAADGEVSNGLDQDDWAPASAFFELPERLLDEYVERRDRSVLGRILNTARQLRDRVDRVVVLSNRSIESSVRALFEASCEPYFNELPRGQRGGRPRVYFAGSDLDNDHAAGLLTLLTEGRYPERLEDRWAILVCGSACGSLPTSAAFRHFLSAFRSFYRDDAARLAELAIPISGDSGGMPTICETLGCRQEFSIPAGIEGCFSVFSAAGLLPAALLGLDVVRLLEGASTMNDHFRTAPVGRNAVLDFVGVGRLWESCQQAGVRGLRIWTRALQSAGRWYLDLQEESFRRRRFVVSSGQDHGPRQAPRIQDAIQQRRTQQVVLWTNLIVEHCRCDPLTIGRQEPDTDGWNHLADQTHPALLASAIRETSHRDRQNGCPAADIRLKRLNEHTLGQLLQMWMLASEVERCLGPTGDGDDSGGRQMPKDFGAGFLYAPASICYTQRLI